MLYNVKKGENLYKELIKKDVSLAAFCGGTGTCGKCKVRVIKGDMTLTEIEERLLSLQEIEHGIRLACCHKKIVKDTIVEIIQDEKQFDILGMQQKKFFVSNPKDGVSIAMDIGTTTIVMAYINLLSGELIKEDRFVNPQRVYGADVLSRIQACKDNSIDVVRDVLIARVNEGILNFEREFNIPIVKMVVAANATMAHIFMRINPKTIAEYPYTCKEKNYRIFKSNNFFKVKSNFEIHVLPAISAFVGGDIVSGIFQLDMHKGKEKNLLIDLGTNGEIALSSEKYIYTTSVAAGPAFEGGNMKCGMASIEGAISHVKYENQWEFTTICNAKPKGICGSGYMEIMAELKRHAFIDETGYMDEEVKLQQEIEVVQEDIRNFQLAKSAVRTGIELLQKYANVEAENILNVYIAGGFGKSSRIQDMIDIKMIPECFKDKIIFIGNASLNGAIKYLLEGKREQIENILRKSKNFNLAEDKQFVNRFADNMFF